MLLVWINLEAGLTLQCLQAKSYKKIPNTKKNDA